MSIDEASLFRMAKVFAIDYGSEITIEARYKNVWAICKGSLCFNKRTQEWEYESSPSNRSAEFINDTRFSSLQEAWDTYWNYKNSLYYIEVRCREDDESEWKWHLHNSSKDKNEMMKYFKGMQNYRLNSRFVGKLGEVLGTFEAKKVS